MSDQAPYVIITGSAYSGSSLALRLFDCHENTVCRNNPQSAKNGVVTALKPARFLDDLDAYSVAEAWPDTVPDVRTRIGREDLVGTNPKVYHRGDYSIGFANKVMMPKAARAVASLVMPSLKGAEGPAPRLYASRRKLRDAILVARMTGSEAFLGAAFEADPNMHLVQTIRDPEMALKVWWDREGGDVKATYDRLLPTVWRILDLYEASREPYTTPSRAVVLRMAVWGYRYANEYLLLKHLEDPRFRFVRFETLSANPVDTAISLYRFLGIDFLPKHAQIIRDHNRRFRARETDQLSYPDAEMCAAVEEVLGSSLLSNLWKKQDDELEVGLKSSLG